MTPPLSPWLPVGKKGSSACCGRALLGCILIARTNIALQPFYTYSKLQNIPVQSQKIRKLFRQLLHFSKAPILNVMTCQNFAWIQLYFKIILENSATYVRVGCGPGVSTHSLRNYVVTVIKPSLHALRVSFKLVHTTTIYRLWSICKAI